MKKRITDVDRSSLDGCTVVVRVDFNVPLDEGEVSDDRRIRAAIPTLELLLESGARVVLLSHLGRPDGEKAPEFSLEPVADRLADLLDRPVRLVPDGPLEEIRAQLAQVPEDGVALLENTRFLKGETENDPELAAKWAALGDLFVNDAFGVAHRAHASTAGLAKAMIAKGGQAVAGLLMAKELEFLQDALRDPARPFTGILGGAKISGKIGVISALLGRVDSLLIGGAMANTFFRAMGHDTGESLVEEDAVDTARSLLEQAGERLVLPVDCVVASEVRFDVDTRYASRDDVHGDDKIVDIGPETREMYADIVRHSKSVLWNGPMGVFEIDPFASGTIAVARAVAEACDNGALGVIGGGDSGAAVDRARVGDRVTHVSTGGGASIKLLAGAELPGLETLSDRSPS